MSYRALTIAAVSALAVAGCTTSEVLTIQQPGDRSMTCAELEGEFREIERVVEDAQGIEASTLRT